MSSMPNERMEGGTPPFPVIAQPRLKQFRREHDPGGGWEGGLIDRLMKIFGLLPYGRSGLTPAAHHDLARGSLYLAALSLFELFAWSTFVNMLIHAGRPEISLLTPLAILGGALMSLMVVTFDSQFLAADLSRVQNKYVSIGGRALLIGAGAFATSMPWDMLVFRGEVLQRHHQERTLAEAPVLARQWAKENQRARQLNSDELVNRINQGAVLEKEKLDAATENADGARRQWEQARATLARAESAVASLRSRLAAAVDSADRRLLNSQLNQAMRDRDRLRAAAQSLQSQHESALKVQDKWMEAFEGKRKEVLGGIKADNQMGERQRERIEKWLHTIYNAPPGQDVTEPAENLTADAAPWTYPGARAESNLSMMEQWRIIGDLMTGRKPKRPSLTALDRDILTKQFRLEALLQGVEDPEDAERRRDMATQFTRSMIGWTVFFAFIPLLILLAKALMHEDTKLYLSRDHQRKLGYPGILP